MADVFRDNRQHFSQQTLMELFLDGFQCHLLFRNETEESVVTWVEDDFPSARILILSPIRWVDKISPKKSFIRSKCVSFSRQVLKTCPNSHKARKNPPLKFVVTLIPDT